MKHRARRGIMVAAATSVGVVLGWITSAASLVLTLSLLPPGAWQMGAVVPLAILAAITGVAAAGLLCGRQAKAWAERWLGDRPEGRE